MDREWTDEQIATWAIGLRKFAGQSIPRRLRILDVIAKLQAADDSVVRIEFVEVSDDRLPYSDAEAEPQSNRIRYRRSLMDRLVAGHPEATEIMLEEIGHIFLHKDTMTLNHFRAVDFRARNMETVRRKEREARMFALHVLAPIEDTYPTTDPSLLQHRYGLSKEGAEEYCEHLRRTRARIEGKRRADCRVVSFEEEAEKRHYHTQPIIPEPSQEQLSAERSVASGTSGAPERESPEQLATREMGFLPDRCEKCGNPTIRSQSGCKVCETCGDSEGCD